MIYNTHATLGLQYYLINKRYYQRRAYFALCITLQASGVIIKYSFNISKCFPKGFPKDLDITALI